MGRSNIYFVVRSCLRKSVIPYRSVTVSLEFPLPLRAEVYLRDAAVASLENLEENLIVGNGGYIVRNAIRVFDRRIAAKLEYAV